MAAAGLMRTGENRINYMQGGIASNPLRGQSESRPYQTIALSHLFQRPHDRRSDRDDPRASQPRMSDGRRGG